MQLIGPQGVVSERVEEMNTFYSRWRGLRGRTVDNSTAALFDRCRQVHTFGMRDAIDVVFRDAAQTVVHVQTLAPRRISRYVRGARSCVELAGGRAAGCGLVPGVRLVVEP